MRKYVFAATAAVLMSACSSVSLSSAPLAMKDGMLVNDKGMTVYTFDKDVASSGKSACNDKCAVNWPPVLATVKDQPQGPYTIVVRDDGRRQWAYKGKPVYTWPEDQEPGDKYGDKKLNIWHIVTQ